MSSLCVRIGACALLAAGFTALGGCGKAAKEDLVYGQTVRGKVTYEGQPVPYGFVLFYSHDKSRDAKAGTFTPSAVGAIVDGAYEIANAPLGHVAVCVATDPDIDAGMLTRPMKPGEKTSAGGDKGGVPGMPGGAPGMPVGPPDGKPDMPPPGEVGLIPPKPPPGLKPPPANPLTVHLSEAQRKTLKDIHARFGEFGKSPLAFEVKEGAQTFDIKLHK
jgi:hypothetical protein